MPIYIYALLVIDQGSGSTPKGPSQTPETMGWMIYGWYLGGVPCGAFYTTQIWVGRFLYHPDMGL